MSRFVNALQFTVVASVLYLVLTLAVKAEPGRSPAPGSLPPLSVLAALEGLAALLMVGSLAAMGAAMFQHFTSDEER
ncbi:MAG: hypothetical protein AAF192_02830 [Pseudomonadota bacterium]